MPRVRCPRSDLRQLFRAHLVLRDKVRAVFEKSLELARQRGYLKSRKVKVALDTSNILGRGAVKDTYNLLADGIVKLVRALASDAGSRPEAWATANGLERYFSSSIKGSAEINWDDEQEKQAFLTGIVADADRLLEMTREAMGRHSEGSAESERLLKAAELLAQLLLQDLERTEEGACIKEGVGPDRIVSVHDPEMRHGRKSRSKRFDGHKAAVVVDTDTQLITAATVLAGNAPDHSEALELVEQAEKNAQVEVEEAIGDCAYGDGATRQAFVDAGRKLTARVPGRPNRSHSPKEDFTIDVEARTCRCPAGHECRTLKRRGTRKTQSGTSEPDLFFQFDAAVCAACRLRASCVAAGPGKGRTVTLHPQEALLQEARAFQKSEAYAPYRKLRQVAEHRLARLMQLGVRQARYFGRTKTLYQLLLAATVANLTLVATHTGLMKA